MASLDVKKINSRLQIKGFQKEDTDHHCFYYVNNGLKTNIWTKTSFGSKKQIYDDLIIKMSKQVKLNKIEFMKLIECTLSKEEYRKLLIERGYIKD